MTSEFIQRLQRMLQNHPQIIQWNEKGSEIVIMDTRIFAKEMLHKYFRHGKLSSFVRQLNMYDFRKIVRKKFTINFWNKHFRKGNSHNYHLILRRNRKGSEFIPNQAGIVGISDQLKMELSGNQRIYEIFHRLLTFKNKTTSILRTLKSSISEFGISDEIPKSVQSEISEIRNLSSSILSKSKIVDRLSRDMYIEPTDPIPYEDKALKESKEPSDAFGNHDLDYQQLPLGFLQDDKSEFFNHLFEI